MKKCWVIVSLVSHFIGLERFDKYYEYCKEKRTNLDQKIKFLNSEIKRLQLLTPVSGNEIDIINQNRIKIEEIQKSMFEETQKFVKQLEILQMELLKSEVEFQELTKRLNDSRQSKKDDIQLLNEFSHRSLAILKLLYPLQKAEFCPTCDQPVSKESLKTLLKIIEVDFQSIIDSIPLHFHSLKSNISFIPGSLSSIASYVTCIENVVSLMKNQLSETEKIIDEENKLLSSHQQKSMEIERQKFTVEKKNGN